MASIVPVGSESIRMETSSPATPHSGCLVSSVHFPYVLPTLQSLPKCPTISTAFAPAFLNFFDSPMTISV